MIVEQSAEALREPVLASQQALLCALGDERSRSGERAGAPLQPLGALHVIHQLADKPEHEPEDHRGVLGTQVDLLLNDGVPERAQQLRRAVHRTADLGT